MSGSGSESMNGPQGTSVPKPAIDPSSEFTSPQIMNISSDEVNYLIFRYLQESGFVHSAFSFAHESMLGRTGLRSADKALPPGALISFLQKGLQYVGIEERLRHDSTGGRKAATETEGDFSLLSPLTVATLARKNPPIQLNVPPAAAAAAMKAKLEVESKLHAERMSNVMASQIATSGPLAPIGLPPVMDIQNAHFARQALAAQAAAAHAAAALSQLQQLGHQPTAVSDLFSQQKLAQPHVNTAAELMGLQKNNLVQQESTASSGGIDTLAVTAQGGKRVASGSKRSIKKQKKDKPDSRKGKLIDDAKKSLEGKDLQPMDVEENDNQADSASLPAHKGNSPQPLPAQEPLNGQAVEINGSTGQTTTSGVNGGQHEFTRKNVDQQQHSTIDVDKEDAATDVSPKEILKLEMHQSEVFMCAWNPVFSDLIATGSGDASARIWQMRGLYAAAGLTTVKLLPHGTDPRDKKNKDVTTLEWSSDGLLLATGSYDGVARVWARNGALMHTLKGHNGPIFSLKWNKRGNFLLSGSYDKTTIVWDVSGPAGFVEQQFTDHQAPALDVDWKDDVTFASCSTDKTVHICRVGVPKPLKVYSGHTDEVNAVKWDPSGQLLASCSDDCTAKVWDVESDRTDPLHDLTSHQQEIYTVKWSPTGSGSKNPSKKAVLATASFDGSVRLWDVKDGSCYRVFNRHRDSVYSVAFSPSGDYLASGSLAGQMYIWNIEEGRHIKSYKGKGDIFEVAWNKEETRVAACFSSNVVAVIDFDKSTII
jgi:transducin (beta)-like 1